MALFSHTMYVSYARESLPCRTMANIVPVKSGQNHENGLTHHSAGDMSQLIIFHCCKNSKNKFRLWPLYILLTKGKVSSHTKIDQLRTNWPLTSAKVVANSYSPSNQPRWAGVLNYFAYSQHWGEVSRLLSTLTCSWPLVDLIKLMELSTEFSNLELI